MAGGGRAGKQDGVEAAHRRRCFMAAVRSTTEAARGRCGRLDVPLPFGAATPDL